MRSILVTVVLVACGNVETTPKDAGGDGKQPDAALCTDMMSPLTCGPTCMQCPAGDRQDPTCNGIACGTTCKRNAPTCSDSSCSKTLFDFNSGTLEGAAPVMPTNLAMAVRTNGGSPALALDVTNLSEVRFRIPVCLSGNVNMMAKTLTAKVWFDGAGTSPGQFYVQASVPTPVTGNYLETRDTGGAAYQTLSFTMSMSVMSQQTNDVTFKVGTLGQQFSGTVWFEDITLQ